VAAYAYPAVHLLQTPSVADVQVKKPVIQLVKAVHAVHVPSAATKYPVLHAEHFWFVPLVQVVDPEAQLLIVAHTVQVPYVAVLTI